MKTAKAMMAQSSVGVVGGEGGGGVRRVLRGGGVGLGLKCLG